MADAKERVGRVRKGNRTGGYTVIQNSLVNDVDLSAEARLLMIYLLSRPEDWELQIADVRRFLGVAGKPCGRDKAYRVVAELKALRYLVMCEDVHDGHFSGVTYYIFDQPAADPDGVRKAHRASGNGLDAAPETPLPDFQEAEPLPLPDFPYPENQEPTNKRYIQTTDTPKPPRQRTRHSRNGSETGGSQIPLPSGIIAVPWSREWVAHRVNRLMRGREQSPSKPTRFLEQLIAKGGEAGERARLDHQAKTCWPTVTSMDAAAVNEGRGWRVPEELFGAGLEDAYHSVSVDSEEFHDWQREHRRRGWPELPRPATAARVWLPIAGVQGLMLQNGLEGVAV